MRLRLTPFLALHNKSLFSTSTTAAMPAANPILANWAETSPYGLPPFADIKPQHFEHAFEVTMAEHREEVRAIASNPDKPTFENTVVAFDRAGETKDKVSALFSNLCSSLNTDDMQVVQRAMSGPLSMHTSKIYTEPGLFDRIDAVYRSRHDLGLLPEQVRLVERFHLDFVRAGSTFNQEAKDKYAALQQRHAQLTTDFTQNLLKDEAAWDLDLQQYAHQGMGLPEEFLHSSQQAAKERDKEVKDKQHYGVMTLSRSMVEPFLKSQRVRHLRQTVYEAFKARGQMDPSRDNLAIARDILSLRAEMARMHGYASFAEFALKDTMAGTPEAVMELLEKVWEPAKRSADKERRVLAGHLNLATCAEGEEPAVKKTRTDRSEKTEVVLEPWDWDFLADVVRRERFGLDEDDVKPYFELDTVVKAAFHCVHELFGLTFALLPDVAGYHPDVQVYRVTEGSGADEKLVGVFLHDNFARVGKQSGAWMSELRGQARNGRENLSPELSCPIILNNNNFAKGQGDTPTMLSFSNVRTLFHELGHGLHGLLSDVTYQRLSGTSVLRDFVELPSQLFEHWMEQESVLKKHFVHHQTGLPMDDALLSKLLASQKFNQGYSTIEYTSSALVDLGLHRIGADKADAALGHVCDTDGNPLAPLLNVDVSAFESAETKRLGMPDGILLRHRPSHFQHIFSTDAYASAYYVYLWAEVLDADAFGAFLEAGDIFDNKTATRLRECIYSKGNSVEPGELFRRFRGRDPDSLAMMKKKGLIDA